MGADTKIEWAHHTFNPWRGCSHVSPGCEHCYAETLSARYKGAHGTWGAGGERVIASESYWGQPARWDRAAGKAGERRRVFCASLADVFEGRPDLVAPRERLWRLIYDTPHLDWLLLTKRPENAHRMLTALSETPWTSLAGGPPGQAALGTTHDPLPNLWLGVSVEDQRRADERIPVLLATPAAVRFVSAEPLLGPVDLSCWLGDESVMTAGTADGRPVDLYYGGVDWLIVGGESGPGARPMHPDWARSLRDQCAAAGVPYFFKQWGEWAPMDLGNVRVDNPRHVALHGSGATAMTPENPHDPYRLGHPGWIGMRRVGKRAAGRELDGRTWDEFPGRVRGIDAGERGAVETWRVSS